MRNGVAEEVVTLTVNQITEAMLLTVVVHRIAVAVTLTDHGLYLPVELTAVGMSLVQPAVAVTAGFCHVETLLKGMLAVGDAGCHKLTLDDLHHMRV